MPFLQWFFTQCNVGLVSLVYKWVIVIVVVAVVFFWSGGYGSGVVGGSGGSI